MSLKRNLIVGAAAVYAADSFAGYLPLPTVGGINLSSWVAAIGGAWVGERVLGTSVSLMHAAVLGVTALAAAELKNNVISTPINLPVVGDASRMLAGALGVWAGAKFGIESKA